MGRHLVFDSLPFTLHKKKSLLSPLIQSCAFVQAYLMYDALAFSQINFQVCCGIFATMTIFNFIKAS